MLDVSRALNPECEHIEGDMRDVRLGRTFDAVFVHDAIDYMTTEGDLRRAMQTAFAHCRPGGVAVFVPDHTTESFVEDADHGGHDGPDGRAVRYFFWTTLDAGSRLVRTDYVFLLRDADGELEVIHDRHHTGLFTTETWLRLLAEVGFEPSVVEEVTVEERAPRLFFVGRRTGGVTSAQSRLAWVLRTRVPPTAADPSASGARPPRLPRRPAPIDRLDESFGGRVLRTVRRE